MRPRRVVAVAIVTALLQTAGLRADPVAVRHVEGTNHGLLALRATDGRLLASGEQTQTVSGDRITIHLVFRFTDGSLSDERTTFSQRGAFRLIRYQLAQKGPSFPRAIDMTIDAANDVAATPKPRVVKLVIQDGGLAPLVGKEPPDSHVWILRGEAPVFVRSETTLFMGGPMWRIEPASIAWPAR